MKSFNILDPKTPVRQRCLIEASAGTGKTFTIEHLYLRLLLEEASFSLDNILVVTFTKKATRELKQRIFQTLQILVKILKEGKTPFFPYLSSFSTYSPLQKKQMQRKLEDTLTRFDSALIFTIHGFCLKMLQEFAFEANQGFIAEESSSQKSFYPIFSNFLKTLSSPHFSAWDMSLLLKSFPSTTLLFSKVLQTLEGEEAFEIQPLKIIAQALQEKLSSAPSENLPFWETDFYEAEKHFKKAPFPKANFPEEVTFLKKWLQEKTLSLEDLQNFLFLNPSLSLFFHPSNQKRNTPNFHWENLKSSFLWKWLFQEFYPTLQPALSVKRALHELANEFYPIWKAALEEGSYCSPAEILRNMRRAIFNEAFCQKVQNKCKAAIVDEFQDTDPLQWEILQKLFTISPAFYLVGDPKQSIYGFRKADIYTYLSAKQTIQTTYSLKTNYRSTFSLIQSLNTLFAKKKTWIFLPKKQSCLSYEEVKAAKTEESKGKAPPLSFFIFEEEKQGKVSSKELEQNFFFPFLYQKIQAKSQDTDKVAILVKDRFQGRAIQSYLEKRGIVCSCKSSSPLGKTKAASAFKELILFLYEYPNHSLMKLVLLGPLGGFAIKDLQSELLLEKAHLAFSKLQEKLFTSFPLFVSSLLHTRFSNQDKTVKQQLYFQGPEFYEDFFQLLEFFLRQSQDQKLPKDLFLTFMEELEEEFQEEALGNKRPSEVNPKITILTIHASKGLEFDTVFAYGVAFSQTKKDPLLDSVEALKEQDAEKLRQFYVALTRAKKELYIPLILLKNNKLEVGTSSAVELFFSYLLHDSFYSSLKSEEILNFLTQNPDFQLCFLSSQETGFSSIELKASLGLHPPPTLPHFPKETSVFSFSSLQKGSLFPKELPTEFFLPRGPAFGTFIHTSLEKLLLAKNFEKTLESLIHQSEYRVYEKPLRKLFSQALFSFLSSSFCLKDVPKENLWPEVEFVYEAEASSKWVKGFVDLLFFWDGKYYLLDWKTNDLGNTEEDYSQESLFQEMERENYFLQASLYREALHNYFLLHKLDFSSQFGGMYYIFLRGLFFNQGIYHFFPDPSHANQAMKRIE